MTTRDPNQNCSIGFDGSASGIAQSIAGTRKLGKCRSAEGLHSLNPSKGTNLFILIIMAGDIEMNPGPRSQCRLCKKYCKASELDIQSPDRLSDHDIVSGTLKIVIPPIKKPRRKVYRYQKGDYESMRSDALRFAKER